MTSLFIRADEVDSTGTVSGNSADPVGLDTPGHSASEAAFQITVGASVAVLGGTALELVRRYLPMKKRAPARVHITQEQLRTAYEQAEKASPDSEKP